MPVRMKLLPTVALFVFGFGADNLWAQDPATATQNACHVLGSLVQLGPRDPLRSELFFDVTDGVLLRDGTVAVLSRGNRRVDLFDQSGALYGALGRPGDGPGEFRDPIELDTWRGDSLAVYDWAAGRVTVFPLRGSGARAIRLEPPPQNPTGRFEVLADQTLIVAVQDFRAPRGGAPEAAQELQLLAYGPTGELKDTLLTLPYGRLILIDEQRREVGRPHFQARSTFTAAGNEVLTATGDEPRVYALTTDGESSDRARWEDSPRPVSPADTRALREQQFEDVAAHLRERLARAWDRLPVAREFPVVSTLLAEDDGTIWVERFARPSESDAVWLRLSPPLGDPTCSIRFPDGFSPLAFDGARALGVRRGEFDLEFVEILQVELPTSR